MSYGTKINNLYNKIICVSEKAGILIPITVFFITPLLAKSLKLLGLEGNYAFLIVIFIPTAIFMYELYFIFRKVLGNDNYKKFSMVIVGSTFAILYYISSMLSEKIINRFYSIEPSLMENSIYLLSIYMSVFIFVVLIAALIFIYSMYNFIAMCTPFMSFNHMGVKFIRFLGALTFVFMIITPFQLFEGVVSKEVLMEAGILLDFNENTICNYNKYSGFTKMLPGNRVVIAENNGNEWVFKIEPCFK